MVSKAPEVAEAGAEASGGLGGMVGSALSAFGGGGGLGGLASLAGGFDKLGLDAGMLAKFAPIVKGYFEENGGDVAKNLMSKFL